MITETPRLPPTEITAGLSGLAPRYDLILCDIWGVLHDGLHAHPAAGDALARYRTAGGRVVLVSNAPRPGEVVAAQLDDLGVSRAAYDGLVTSGDLTRAAVIERLDQVVHHVGPERDLPLFAGLDLRFGDIDSADYVVCTGLVDDERETVEDYRERLQRMRARSLWMACANPDLVVERGTALLVCAGAIALAYEEMGGIVYYPGKPHPPIYEAALALASGVGGDVPRDRILAIGDAIRTDIAGAQRFGIDALLVARGIHAAELKLDQGALTASHLDGWLARQTSRPTAVIEQLTWS